MWPDGSGAVTRRRSIALLVGLRQDKPATEFVRKTYARRAPLGIAGSGGRGARVKSAPQHAPPFDLATLPDVVLAEHNTSTRPRTNRGYLQGTSVLRRMSVSSPSEVALRVSASELDLLNAGPGR